MGTMQAAVSGAPDRVGDGMSQTLNRGPDRCGALLRPQPAAEEVCRSVSVVLILALAMALVDDETAVLYVCASSENSSSEADDPTALPLLAPGILPQA